MLVLLPSFILTPRAVRGYHLTDRIGGCGVWDFAVLGTINPNIVNRDFHMYAFSEFFIHIALDMYIFFM